MTKLRRKTVAPKRKPSAKRAGGSARVNAVGWFYRAVNLPYRSSREVDETIKEAVERLT
jgi:hypothetical protein